MHMASGESRGADDDDCIGDDELLRFVEGAVGDPRASAIRSHVDTCDDCRELLAIAGREAAAAEAAAVEPPPRRTAPTRATVSSASSATGP